MPYVDGGVYLKRKIFVILMVILFTTKFSYCKKPDIGAQSAILMDAQSGRVLLEYNPHTRLPMASTTKIMTALVALENAKLDDKVKIKNDAVGIEGSSIYLDEGETLTLEDLLYGLMLRSGNDSSVAIANYIGGNLEKFNNMMNEKAKEIGANNTSFMNPHGLHDDKHYSTAYDLALITRKALELESFKEISSTKSWKANREKNNLFYNKNRTLWEYDGGDGVKTGYTIRAGRCLVSSATRDKFQLISVVLNDRNWFEDCYRLMDYGFEHFDTYVIFDKEQYIKTIPVSNGDKDSITAVTKESFLYPLKEDELDKVKINISLSTEINPPIKKGDSIGKITVFLDGKIIHEEKLISKENVKTLGPVKKFIKEIQNQ